MKKRRAKRFWSFVLVFVMVFSMSFTAFAEEPDVSEPGGGTAYEEGGGQEDTPKTEEGEAETEETQGEEAKGQEEEPMPEESIGEGMSGEGVSGEGETADTQSDVQEQPEAGEQVKEDAEQASEAWTAEDFTYSTYEHTFTGCDYTRTIVVKGTAVAGFSESGLEKLKDNKNLVLPAVGVGGEPLVGVADSAFKDKGLESVTFPEGMMVDYDDTVTHVVTRRGNYVVGVEAFAKNELTEVTLPEGVLAVMSSAFKNNQLKRVTLPHTVWWIENGSFSYNELTAVGFPKTCDFQLQIHAFAFSENQIRYVRLPDYTEVVEKKAFYFNPGMEACPPEAPEKEQGFGGVVAMYTDNPDLVNKERIHHIEKTAESQKSWHQRLIVGSAPVEDDTWNVNDFLIEGTKITGLSESGIAKRQLNKDLVLPDKNQAGEAITEIAETTNQNGLFATEEEGFDSVTLPRYLEVIGMRAFSESGLKSVTTFPDTLREIGIAAFSTNQLKSVILPDSVTKVGGGAFGSNPTLEVIILSKGLTEIEAGAFGCSDAKNYMENLTSLTIPDSVVKIGNNAFAGNHIKDLVIPSSVKEIGAYAFSTKNYLKDACTITLSEGLEKIGNRAFRNKVVEEVDLPSTVTGLSDKVFEKEYSDATEAGKTKVYVNKAQYADKENFPASDYHELIIRVDENDTQWDAYDFEYAQYDDSKDQSEVTLYPAGDSQKKVILSPYCITGLSSLGKAKIEKNPDIVIPAEDPDGKKVTGIGKGALQKLGIRSVTFPQGVMTAYDGPEGILAEGLSERGDFIIMSSAFLGNELTEVTLPEGVIAVGTNAFKGNKSLSAVTLPHTIWRLASGAFADGQIKNVEFPEDCDFKLNIDSLAFGINQIQAVQLPVRTEKVDATAFMNNTGMEAVSEEAPSKWKKGGVVYLYADPSVAEEPFVAHDGLEDPAKKSWAQRLIVDEDMPEELRPWTVYDFTYDGAVVTGLSESGIAKRKNHTGLVLPDVTPEGETVTALADTTASNGLFASQEEKFEKVTLPAALERIGNNAFADSGIAQIEFPDTLREIGNSAFRQNNLVHVILPDSVTAMGTGVFASNFSIETAKLSKGMTEVPSGLFSCAGAQTAEHFKEIEIPEGVTKIGSSAFAGNSFTKVEIPSGVKEIGSNAFSQTDKMRFLKEIVLPEGLESIGSKAFNFTLAEEVNLPSTVTTLHKNAFYNMDGKKVKLYTKNKDQLTDHGTFVAKSSYHETIYSNLIGSGWDYGDFTFDGPVLTGWSEKGNETRLRNKTLVLPEMNPESQEAVSAIADRAFKIPDDEVEQLKESVYSPNGMETVVIPQTVTEIGEKAFEYNNFKTVAFPEGLTTMKMHAFHGNKLETVTLPERAVNLGEGAFAENSITQISLPAGLEKIPQGFLSMNIFLESVEIPASVTEIGDMAFAGARLTSLTIPESVTKIGRKAFHLHHLSELTVPGNVKEIKESAFEGTPKAITLKTLVLEEGIETIGSNAFKEGYLESVRLPDSLQSLAPDAFAANAGTNQDHVVVCYTGNIDHLSFPESDSHRIVYEGEWGIDCFTFDGQTITGFSEKGAVLVGQKKEVVLPDVTPDGKAVTGIAAGAFKGYGITKVILPKYLQTIAEEAFAENDLTSVELPDTILTIAADAFAGNGGTVELIVRNEEAAGRLEGTEYDGAKLVEKLEDEEEGEPGTKDPGQDTQTGGKGQPGSRDGQTGKKGVKTGDEAPVLPAAGLMGAAALAVLAALARKRKA